MSNTDDPSAKPENIFWTRGKLTAEQRAHAGAGEPEGMIRLRIECDDEAVAQDVPDGARLDVAALGGEPAAAPFVPIGE